MRLPVQGCDCLYRAQINECAATNAHLLSKAAPVEPASSSNGACCAKESRNTLQSLLSATRSDASPVAYAMQNSPRNCPRLHELTSRKPAPYSLCCGERS